VQLGHAHCHFDRLAAGGEQHGAVEAAGERGHQGFGQVEHRRGQHPRVQVDGGSERALDRLADARVIVADGGADLAGGEIEDAPAVGRGHPGAVGLHDDVLDEVAAVANEVVVHQPRASVAEPPSCWRCPCGAT
jgi:hypothetical protein